MDRKKSSKENKRLEKQKIARRIRYAEIKADPVLYELEKEKEKRRYQKRKDQKKIKSVNQLSPRDQREKRKKWREAAKKYRENKKEESKKQTVPEVSVLIDTTIEETEDSKEKEAMSEDPLKLNQSPQADVKIRRIRYIEQKKRKYLMTIIKKLKEENNQLKVKLNKCMRKEQNKEKNKIESTEKVKRVINKEKSKEDSRIRQLFVVNDTTDVVICSGRDTEQLKTRLNEAMSYIHTEYISNWSYFGDGKYFTFSVGNCFESEDMYRS
nr:histone-lysine N-methyltransferase, H3 lysine-79 specific [Helicoverpa armigera]